MGRRLRLGIFVVALFACLALPLGAQTGSRIYTIPVPGATASTRIDYQPAALPGDWQVTVTLDSARCEIYCVYRRMPDVLARRIGTLLLLPPPTAIHIHPNAVTKPETVVVDPAGVQGPLAVASRVAFGALPYIPGRKSFPLAIAQNGFHCIQSGQECASSALSRSRETFFATPAPLRI